MTEEIQITEDDLATLLKAKSNQIVSLEIEVTCLKRVLSERVAEIEELKGYDLARSKRLRDA